MAIEKPIFLSAEEVAAHLTMHRNHIYRLMDRGELQDVKFGRRRVVRYSELERYIAAHEATKK